MSRLLLAGLASIVLSGTAFAQGSPPLSQAPSAPTYGKDVVRPRYNPPPPMKYDTPRYDPNGERYGGGPIHRDPYSDGPKDKPKDGGKK
jgi:hypothetical protein